MNLAVLTADESAMTTTGASAAATLTETASGASSGWRERTLRTVGLATGLVLTRGSSGVLGLLSRDGRLPDGAVSAPQGSVRIGRPHLAAALVATGTACGITWAATLCGWMIQMAGPAQSQFTWYGPFGPLIAPGAVVGAAFGYAEYRHRTAGARSRWLTLAPPAFLVALTMPWIFRALITSGVGGGAIGVVTFGLAGRYALSGRGRASARAHCGVLALSLVLTPRIAV